MIERLPMCVSAAELERRSTALRKQLDQRGAIGFVGFSAATIQYLTGYAFTPTERPHAVLLEAGGTLTLFAPILKAEAAHRAARVDTIVTYPEYPGDRHPMQLLADHVAGQRDGNWLLEADGYSSPHGYHGPTLASLLMPESWCVDARMVERLREIKSAEEILLLRHAAHWALRAHRLLQDAVAIDAPESMIAGQATGAVMRQLRARIAESDAGATGRAFAGFGGQIGADGTAHHAPASSDPTVRAGDLLISQVGAWVGGYYADVERTMMAGEASPAVRDLFERGLEIQRYAIDRIWPGVTCASVDRDVIGKTRALGLGDCWRHHTGHSVGVLNRESPYLDVGNPTELEPGMVVTVEPGVYRDGVGGFRHSDLMLVTEGGAEVLTPYPSDLASLICG